MSSAAIKHVLQSSDTAAASAPFVYAFSNGYVLEPTYITPELF